MRPRVHSLPFELRSLEVFLAVCESGSMASGARIVGMTQPAVSQTIAELERKMGMTLFDRHVRPLALTTAGGMLRQYASALISEARQIVPLLRDTEQGRVPLIRVGLVDSLSRALIGPLAAFLESRVKEVSFLSGLTAAHASQLLTRRLDVFLGVDDLQDLPGLERWELITEPYVLLVPAGTKQLRTLKEFREFAGELPLIRFSARSQTGLEIERHLRRLGLDLPRSCEFDAPFGAGAMVAAGRGFAITTPLCVAEAQVPMADVSIRRLPGPQISRKLTVVARHREFGRLPRDIAHFSCALLREALSGSP